MALSFGAVIPAIFITAIVLRTVTCYYFRFLLRRFAFFHPTHCNTKHYLCDPERNSIWGKWPFSWVATLFGKTLDFGDSKLFYYHKYFIWATVILMPFHLKEIIPVFINAVTSFSLLSFEVMDITIELVYVLFGVMFILSCHSIKYFFDRSAQKCGGCAFGNKVYKGFENANHIHGLWLWLTIIFINIRMVLLLMHGTPVGQALVMLFVRLPEHV